MKLRSILFIGTLLGLALYFGIGSSPAPIMATDEDAMPAYKPPVHSSIGSYGASGIPVVNGVPICTTTSGSTSTICSTFLVGGGGGTFGGSGGGGSNAISGER